MKALVTGASGFIGRHLVETLLARDHEVKALVRDPARLGGLSHPRLTPVTGDLGDPASLVAAAAGTDVVFHLAAVLRARTDAEYDAVNARGTRAVVDAVRAAAATGPNRRPRIIYVSSLAAGGPCPDGRPLTGDEPPRPISAYGRTKLAGETIIRESSGGLPWMVLRPPPVYGPRDKDILVVLKALKRGVMPILGSGRQIVPMVHVADLAMAVALAGESDRSGRIYYITDGALPSYRDVLETMARALGVRPFRLPVPLALIALGGEIGQLIGDWTGRPMVLNRDKVGELQAPGWACSTEPARRELGYAPRFDLESGMRDTVRWYRENRWL